MNGPPDDEEDEADEDRPEPGHREIPREADVRFEDELKDDDEEHEHSDKDPRGHFGQVGAALGLAVAGEPVLAIRQVEVRGGNLADEELGAEGQQQKEDDEATVESDEGSLRHPAVRIAGDVEVRGDRARHPRRVERDLSGGDERGEECDESSRFHGGVLRGEGTAKWGWSQGRRASHTEGTATQRGQGDRFPRPLCSP